ncbi:MAG: hypothetical protein R3B70_06465 [Polyangiaceae bacterium]
MHLRQVRDQLRAYVIFKLSPFAFLEGRLKNFQRNCLQQVWDQNLVRPNNVKQRHIERGIGWRALQGGLPKVNHARNAGALIDAPKDVNEPAFLTGES